MFQHSLLLVCLVNLRILLKKIATTLSLVAFASKKCAHCHIQARTAKAQQNMYNFRFELSKPSKILVIIFRPFWPAVSRFVATKDVFLFVATKVSLPRQNYCHKKLCLSRQVFIATNVLSRQFTTVTRRRTTTLGPGQLAQLR